MPAQPLNNVRDLHDTILALHGCESRHVETAHVLEMMDGQTVWQGDVEVFDLEGHPRAARAFAWSWIDDAGERHHIAVLNVPPIDTPREAVQAAIASGHQR